MDFFTIFFINGRDNPSLQNNSFGSEIFSTVFFSVKSLKDISRSQEKNKKIWFIKYKLKEKKRNISLRINIAILNSSFRNGYAYLNQSSVVNNPEDIYDNYEFNTFSGLRFNSQWNYTKILKNNNMIQTSYIWDWNYTKDDFDRFEMSNHILKITYLFNLNSK